MGKVGLTKIKSSSLIETIVAMVIIMIVFGIGTSIVVQTSLKKSVFMTLKANSILEKYSAETGTRSAFFDDSEQVENFQVKRAVRQFDNLDGVYLIHYSIHDQNGGALLEWKEIVRDLNK